MDQVLIDAYRYGRQMHPRMSATKLLELARRDVSEGKKRYPHAPGWLGNGHWQQWERGSWCATRAYYCDEWPLRVEGRADEVCRAADRSRVVDHTGWFTDDDYSNTIAGYVLRLPHGRCVPGWTASEWDGVTLYPNDVYDDAVECAIAADRYAEQAAETERDYRRASDAGRQAAEAIEGVGELRRKIIETCGHVRRLQRDGTSERDAELCVLAREWICEWLEEIREMRAKRDALRDDVPRGLINAFNEGFGSI